VSRWSDRIVSTILVVLVIASPLAIGGVCRGALPLIEIAGFSTFIAWAGKVWSEAPNRPRLQIGAGPLRKLILPIGAFAVLILLQLVPLPPTVLRSISPATYRVFEIAYPGWPTFPRHHALGSLWSVAYHDRPLNEFTRRWLAITIAPSVSWSSLLEWLAFSTIFLVVLAFPIGLIGERDAERRFYRIICAAVLCSGILITIIGLAQQACWNGKLLWFYVPEDWGAPMKAVGRMRGPFVDPDHFANYLAMVLPLAVVTALYPLQIMSPRRGSNLQLIAALGSLLMAGGLLLSLSRAGWIAGLIGVAVALQLIAHNAPGPLVKRFGKKVLWLVVSGIALVIIGLIASLGPNVRADVAGRVSASLPGAGAAYRFGVWRDTLAMARDFPLFGLGIGAWPDLFPHYHSAPWMPFFFREAENDYLQLLTECGIVGCAIAIWFAVVGTKTLHRGAVALSARTWPMFAGLVGGVAAALFHELFDFSLRMPANAALCTILLALAFRIALTEGLERQSSKLRAVSRPVRFVRPAAAALVIVLIGLNLTVIAQDGRWYPYNVARVNNDGVMALTLLDHPAIAQLHAMAAERLAQAGSSDLRDAQLRAAVWLDPNQPEIRDAYAKTLLTAGQRTAGLRQMSLSVLHAPNIRDHSYLAPALLNWLLPDEQSAIAQGFRDAVAQGFSGSGTAMIDFDVQLGRYGEAAQFFVNAARSSRDQAQRIEYICEAGRSYSLAQNGAEARRVLRLAIAMDPQSNCPYVTFARSVYGPNREMAEAEAIVAQGIRAGADPLRLMVALADAGRVAGDRVAEERALTASLRYTSDFDVIMRLGGLFLADKEFGPAATKFRDAVAIRPESAAAWFALGQSEEGDYDYGSASRDYRRARELAPDNDYYRRVAAAFDERVSSDSLSSVDLENRATATSEKNQ
jgi:tetratricopeptide (TPR) repeat protein